MTTRADALAAPAASGGLLIACGLAAVSVNQLALPGGASLMQGVALVALALDLRRVWGTPARAGHWACLVLTLALATFPSRGAVALAGLPLAVSFWLAGGSSGRGASVLLLSLVGTALLDGPLGSFVAPTILAFEAEATAQLLSAMGHVAEVSGNTVRLPDEQRVLVILRGCSVLALMPAIIVTALVSARMVMPERLPRLSRFAVVLALAFLLNLGRLAAIALSEPAGVFFHDTTGEFVLQLTWTVLATIIAWPPKGQRR